MKATTGERVFGVFNVAFLFALSLAALYPLVFVLFASFSDPGQLAQTRGFLFFPKGFTLDAYEMVFKNPSIGTAYLNTLFYVIVGTSLNIFLSSMAAYGLSRRDVLWKNPIMFMITFTMFFEGGLIPSFLLINELGMMDTRLAIIIPTAISAFNLIIMRTAFQSVPLELEESAKLDGANDFRICWSVIFPLSMPVIAVMLLFYGVSHWNSWFSAMIYLQDRGLFPLQLILREILIVNDTNSMMTDVSSGDQMPIGETIKYATIIIATVPILCVYPFLQKYFVKGVMIGAVKG
ncbi:carbohydrate ABC transporter permease [Paenibacillus sp. IB182493]|uniref:Carbohydrate ABC transporter permease n=2 Tax=Paenibacillus arenilitoris TaxID=2772299 RepID=A0A927CL19_9BACL|nr:carbohydrate ABC transporter permease [Paenibacillus arenilitoris]MBD2868131.1 carbohydrate ABC transporter permease [Paenibacillus arenilitoris]